MTTAQSFFVASNFVIFLGYVFIATFVAKRLMVRPVTLIGAIVFFTTCGLTHLDQVIHTVFYRNERWSTIASSPHMLWIHGVQAIAVWVFAVGFSLDLIALHKRIEKLVAKNISEAVK